MNSRSEKITHTYTRFKNSLSLSTIVTPFITVFLIITSQMTNQKRKRSQFAKDRNRLNTLRRFRQHVRALHQIDLNTAATTSSQVRGISNPFVSPPIFEDQHISPQQQLPFVFSQSHHDSMTLQECYSYLNVGALPPCSLFQNAHVKKSQNFFLSKIYHEKRKIDPKPMFHCAFCKHRFINTHAFFRQLWFICIILL